MSVKRVIGIFVLMALVVYGGYELYAFIQVDQCLDSGGAWDYEREVCRYKPL